jgi:hypothetical protein
MARMTKQDKKRKLTDDEMDALVIADADDQSAWGEPILVRPSGSPRPAWMARSKHLDWAAKFFVVSVLHRMGVEATVTVSQSDDVDITVIQQSGRVLTVDVKTLDGAKKWTVAPFRARYHHYLVFVWYPPNGKPSAQPTAYVVASERLQRFLTRRDVRSLSLEVLENELSAQDAWQELMAAPAA